MSISLKRYHMVSQQRLYFYSCCISEIFLNYILMLRSLGKNVLLQEFADAPLENLAKSYDLLIIDHPWAGFAAKHGILLPLNEYLPTDYLKIKKKTRWKISYQL